MVMRVANILTTWDFRVKLPMPMSKLATLFAYSYLSLAHC